MPFISYDLQGKPSYDLSSARLTTIDEGDFEAVDNEDTQMIIPSTRKVYDLSNAKQSLAGVDMAIDDGDFQVIEHEDVPERSSSPIVSQGTSPHDSPMTPWTQVSAPTEQNDSPSPLVHKTANQQAITSSPSCIPTKTSSEVAPNATYVQSSPASHTSKVKQVKKSKGMVGAMKKMWSGLKEKAQKVENMEKKTIDFGL